MENIDIVSVRSIVDYYTEALGNDRIRGQLTN